MSLVCIAVRIAGVQALKGRTMVGQNVLDSEIGTLDMGADGSVRTAKEKPYISVYVDASKSQEGLELRSLNQNGSVEIIFEAGIASPHVVTDPSTDESVIYDGLAATDANFEFQLDMTMRQIGDVLADPNNEWSAIFQSLSLKLVKYERARISADTQGVRLAAHRLKLTADLIVDPVRGVPLKPQSPFASFLAKCDSDLVVREPDMARNISLMRAQIEGDADELATSMQRYGMVHREADAMLLTPGLP